MRFTFTSMCPFTATFHSFYLTMYTCMTCILQSESFRKYRDLKRHSFKMSKRHVYETYMLKTFRCSLEGKPLIGFMRINNNVTGKKKTPDRGKLLGSPTIAYTVTERTQGSALYRAVLGSR